MWILIVDHGTNNIAKTVEYCNGEEAAKDRYKSCVSSYRIQRENAPVPMSPTITLSKVVEKTDFREEQ